MPRAWRREASGKKSNSETHSGLRLPRERRLMKRDRHTPHYPADLSPLFDPFISVACSFSRFHVAAGDCFELGRQSYHNRDYYHTVLWMQEAMDRLQEEQNATTTSKPDILEYLAFSTYMQGSHS